MNCQGRPLAVVKPFIINILNCQGRPLAYNWVVKKRDYKNLSENSIYHIYNRGNNKENIFYDEQDYRAFLFRLSLSLGIEKDVIDKEPLLRMPKSRIRIAKSPAGLFKLHSFCLMPNHFHLLLEQCGDKSISQLMLKICTSFAMYLNKKYNRVGYVFQDRFKSVLIENNPQLMWVTSYIHTNPVKDGFNRTPGEYNWSSYNDFASNRNLPIVYKDLILEIFDTKENFIKQTFALSQTAKGAPWQFDTLKNKD